jgi:hypothetical protein
MPIRIDYEYVGLGDALFLAAPSPGVGVPALTAPARGRGQGFAAFAVREGCMTPPLPTTCSYHPGSPSISTTDSDNQHTADRECFDFKFSIKDSEDTFDAEDRNFNDFNGVAPLLDPVDWDGVADAEARISVAWELVDLLSKHGGVVLLSKVGSLLTDRTRLTLRALRIRLLTFLKETPQRKYFRIDGAGGGQVLALRDLRDLAADEESFSLDDVRKEVVAILAPSHRRNAMLLRSLGSSLSYQAKLTLKSHRLNLCQFLAFDKNVVMRKSHAYLADGPDAPEQARTSAPIFSDVESASLHQTPRHATMFASPGSN